MSRHPSFGRIGITKKRNVMKRFERIDLLRNQGRYKDGESVYGLPKTKSAS
jgi:small basic protein (TIGR04137 family)